MTVRNYDDAGKQVPKHLAVRAVQTITQYSTHMDKRYATSIAADGCRPIPRRRFRSSTPRNGMRGCLRRMNLDLPG
jgi:hypothetical protein